MTTLIKQEIYLTVFLTGFLFISVSVFSQTGPESILPSESELPGWRPAGEIKMIKSGELKNLIDGDADLFLEYGFKQVVTRDYYNFKGKVIKLEVYTMDNVFASYGVFLQKSKGQKTFKEYGNTCFSTNKSCGFWKQYYFVLMHSDYSGDTISDGYKQMAGVIDAKIKSRGILPEIMGFSKGMTGNITIFRGPVALSNIYYFGPGNIFNIKEGIAIENNDSKEIILKYSDNNEAVRRFSDAAGILGAIPKFTGFKMDGKYSFNMKDSDGKTLIFKVDDICLDILIK
jgi:hypothetical protein